MKTLPLLGVISMLACPLAALGQTTIFNDNFGSSTLSPTAASPGTHSSTQTAYEIGSTKAITPTISNHTLSLPFNTGSAGGEAQALFTTTPVTLTTAGQYLEIYYTFTDSATIFNGNAAAQEQLNLGLYNSGGSAPTNGTLLNNGLFSTSTTAVTGGATNWLGYSANFAYNIPGATTIYSSGIETRPAQTGANNLNQALAFTAAYAYAGGVSITTKAGVAGEPALTLSSTYTMALQITYVNATTLAITNTLYNGAGIGGSVVNVGGYNASYGGTATGANLLTTTFDGFEVGFRPASSPTTAEDLLVTNVTVIEFTPAIPVITSLTNQIVIQGSNTVLNPTVTGMPAPTYQWQLTNGVSGFTNIPGATSSSLALNNVQYAQNGYVYQLIAANSVGSVTNNMTLSVIVTPSITGLGNQSGAVGSSITISPTVSGVPTPTYQWQTNGVNTADGLDANGSTISGSQSSALTINNAQAADSGQYSLIASNSAGMVTNTMTLTVSAGNVLPSITGPVNQTVIQGNNATFTVTVSGLPTPTLQWLDQTLTPIPGATSTSFTTNNVQYSQNGYTYSLVASNSVGSVTNSATLTVTVPPVITSQPASLIATNTQSVSFTVAATGEPNPTYQWYSNTVAVSSAANSSAATATFTIPNVSPASSGSTYYVQISNSAGSTNSATVALTVNSAMAATAFAPANGATGICYDTPLTVTFSSVPSLGTSGSIKIFNLTNSATPVDTISAAGGLSQSRTFPGDSQAFNSQAFAINGTTVTIYPHPAVLNSNQTYYVTIDTGAFIDAAGANFAGITATNVWQFSTKVGGPVNPLNLMVNPNGSADFVTVQGAVNSVPAANTTPRVINVSNGIYTEIVDISGKNNITFRGQSRLGTVIGYPNNNAYQVPVNGGTTHARMAIKVNANDIAFDNLTLTNMTPQGGSQAEALMIETSAARCIVNNCTIASRQDTILGNTSSSQGYFNNSTVMGNYDYIWGGGNFYFNQCVLETIAGVGPSGANFSAARTGTAATVSTNDPWLNPSGTYTANGMSFVNCSLIADASAGTVTLADANGTANNLVSWYGCAFATNYVAPASSLFSGDYIFWQDMNTTNGVAITFPTPPITSISGADARLLAATNIPVWFYGWVPQLTPNILTNPASQTVTSGSSATFAVVATGIPNPTYQWLTNGVALPGATSATLILPGATSLNVGAYSVVVTTPAGSVTSSPASLVVNPAPPVFTAPIYGTNFIINVGVNLAVSCPATDATLPAPTLSYSLLTGPAGAAVDSGSGNFTWRPTVPQSNSVNTVSVVVSDNGTPSLYATNKFSVTVNPLSAPTTALPAYAGGQFSVSVSGQIGPDYELQSTTNLAGGTWTSVATTNSPAAVPFILTDPNAGNQPLQFYRVVTGPPLP